MTAPRRCGASEPHPRHPWIEVETGLTIAGEPAGDRFGNYSCLCLAAPVRRATGKIQGSRRPGR